MKTIGIIGGLGPQATIDFEKQLHNVSQKLIPQFENQGYPPIITYYIRHAPMKFNDDGTIKIPLEPHPHLLEVAKMLGTNADFLVIPSNTPHLFIKEIEYAAGKKVLNMINITVKEVKRKGLKKVGILAVGHTLRSELYQRPLGKMDIVWEEITDDLAQRLDKAIFAVMEGKDDEESSAVVNEAVNYLRQKGVDAIILGCSELPLLLKDKSKASDILNPTQLLAEAAVKFAIG